MTFTVVVGALAILLSTTAVWLTVISLPSST